MKSLLFAGALLFASWSAVAQNFAPGTTEIEAVQGLLRVQSGIVGNLNAHDFHVYSFQLKVYGANESWNQVPLVEAGHPKFRFIVTTAATADFATRDVTIRRSGQRVVLTVVQLRFDNTPYDDDAWVELRRYELRHRRDENRWVFERLDVQRAPEGTTVDSFIASEKTPEP